MKKAIASSVIALLIPITFVYGASWSLTVPQGGTGQTSFTANSFLVGNGTGSLIASTSPTFGSFIATSTTATSTISGGLEITGGLSVGAFCINCGSGGSFTGGTTTVTNLIVTNTSTSTFAGEIKTDVGIMFPDGTHQTTAGGYTNDDANAYIHASTTIPKTYTTNTFTYLQTLSNLLLTGSTTLQDFTSVNSTTTNATTTNLLTNVFRATGESHFEDFLELHVPATPATPLADHLRLYGQSTQGHTRPVIMDDDGIEFVINRDNVFIARNTSGGTITKGQAVYITGSTGNVPNVSLAKSDSLTTLPAAGLVVADITNNSYGNIMILGNLNSSDTSAFTTGDRLYVSSTTAGSLTNIRPSFPHFAQRMGTVLVSGVGSGSIQVTTAPFVGGEESGTSQSLFTFAGGLISNASSTFTVGTTTMVNINVTGQSELGTVISGIWNGTAIGDAYLTKSGDWTGTLDGVEGANIALLNAENSFSVGTTTMVNGHVTGNLQVDGLFFAPVSIVSSGDATINGILTADHFIATSTLIASTLPYASSTAITVSGNSYLGTTTITSLSITNTGTTTLAGVINDTNTGTSTFSGGINVDSGCVAVNGVCAGGGTSGTTLPSGTMIMYASTTAPSGWLIANGAAVSRTTYASLFTAIGTSYGAGDGSTTFNLPDLRGAFPKGIGQNGTLGANYVGAAGVPNADKFQGHYHYAIGDGGINAVSNTATFTGSATTFYNVTDFHSSTPSTLQAKDILTDGTNGTPRVGAITEPANVGVGFIIKE